MPFRPLTEPIFAPQWIVGGLLCTHEEYTQASQEMLDWYRRIRHLGGMGPFPQPCPRYDHTWREVLRRAPSQEADCDPSLPLRKSTDEVMDALTIRLHTVPTDTYSRVRLSELLQGTSGRHVQLATLLLVDYFKGIKPTNPHHRLSQDQLEKWAIECDIDSSEPPQYIRDFFNAFGTLAWDHPANRAQHSFMEILRMRRNLSDNPSQKAMRLFYRIFETVDAEIDAKTDTLTIRGEAVEWRIRPITGYGGDFYRVQGWNARDYRWESVCIHSLVQHLPTGDHLSTLLRAFSNDTKVAHLVETIQPLVVDYGGFRSQRRTSQHSGMNDRDTKVRPGGDMK